MQVIGERNRQVICCPNQPDRTNQVLPDNTVPEVPPGVGHRRKGTVAVGIGVGSTLTPLHGRDKSGAEAPPLSEGMPDRSGVNSCWVLAEADRRPGNGSLEADLRQAERAGARLRECSDGLLGPGS